MEVIFMLMLIVVTDGVSIGGHHRKRENLCRKYHDLLKTTINEQKEFNEANYVKRDDYNSVQQTLHDEIESRTKLEKIVSLLQTQVSEIQRSIILISGHQKMIKELKSQHKILERNLSTAVSAIEDLNKKSDACEEKNLKLQLKFDSSEQKLNQLKLDNDATQQKLAELMSLRDEFDAITAKTKRIGKHFKDTCETDISCLEGLMCNNNLCECESLRYWNGSLCAPRKTFKDTCHADDHCIEGLVCKTSRCGCKESSRYWNGSLCVPKKNVKENCQADIHCIEGLVCKNSQCECKESLRFWNGSSCAPRPTCDCDSRGTVPNTQCDLNTLQCQCKSYVRGQKCNSCKDGYFYLDQTNRQGCLACWCSGVANLCSSSSYYRDSLVPELGSDGSHNFVLTNRRLSNQISDGFQIDVSKKEIRFPQMESIRRKRESVFFSLPPRFAGNLVSSYGGFLRFTLETHVAQDKGNTFRDVDIEIIAKGQKERLYHLFEPAMKMYTPNDYEILMRESSFRLSDGNYPTREDFLIILSDVEAVLVRATYHTITAYTALRDLRLDYAVPSFTSLGRTPMVERCQCPEGYTGLSCEKCADGYQKDNSSSRCVGCNCNGHASSCDPETGACLNCRDNTEGDRCERCAVGFYGDSTAGTPNDCRPCPCPLTIPSNQFSRSCFLDQDGQVTCDRCPPGYVDRNCDRCDTDRGYVGNPRDVGGICERDDATLRPVVVVDPVRIHASVGGTVNFQCNVQGPGPFNIIWSRIDGQALPRRAQVGPRYTLTIRDIQETDAGRYVCTATNVHGSNRGYVNLAVLGRQQPISVYIEPPKEQTVDEGQSVRFVCVVVGVMQSNFILSWSRVGGLMPKKAIDQNGVLVIPNVRPEDAGNYECTGSDMFHMDNDLATFTVSVSRITIPSFSKTSFAAYPAVQNAWFKMKIEMEFKPSTLDNGIVLYSAQDNKGFGDYVSIALKNGYLEFRYNTGSGPAVLSSRRRLIVNEWVKVTASRKGQKGTLIVNDEKPVKAVSPGVTRSLGLRTMLYIGGTDPDHKLPANLDINNGLVGCVAEVVINSVPVDLIGSAVETYNIQDCGERNT